MATFKIVLDKRTKLKNNKYNLAIRMVNGNDVMYINVSKMTENQYDQVFIKKLKDKESIEFRDTCNGYTKAGKTRIAANAAKTQSFLKGHQGLSFLPV
jgi:hypothetical protein